MDTGVYNAGSLLVHNCKAFDGQVFPNTKGSGPTLPLHIGERSIYTPVINGKILGTRPAVGVSERELRGLSKSARAQKIRESVGQVPATQTYQMFLKKQSVSFQNDALGVSKATLFRKGGIPLTSFTNEAGRTLTLKELRVTLGKSHPGAFVRAGLDVV